MKITLLSILLNLVLIFGLQAHNNEPSRLIAGKVIDKQTGEALAGVKIEVKNTDTVVYSDLNGNFVVAVKAPANAELSVEMAGYTPLTVKGETTGLSNELFLAPR